MCGNDCQQVSHWDPWVSNSENRHVLRLWGIHRARLVIELLDSLPIVRSELPPQSMAPILLALFLDPWVALLGLGERTKNLNYGSVHGVLMLISIVIVCRQLSGLGCKLAVKPAPALLRLSLEVRLRVLEKPFMSSVVWPWAEVINWELRLERPCWWICRLAVFLIEVISHLQKTIR